MTPERAGTMTQRRWLTIAVAAVTSAIVWALSPWAVGDREPWNVQSPYYLLALTIAGIISGALSPKPLWAHYIGAVLGQALYMAYSSSSGPMYVFGVALLFVFSIVFVVAAAVSGYLRTRFTTHSSDA